MSKKSRFVKDKRGIALLFTLAVIFTIWQGTSLFALDEPNKEIVVQGNNKFAFDLYAQLKKEEGNLFFSPFSISTALVMTYAGARGNTATQMANVLHCDLTQEGLHPIFAELTHDLSASPEKNGYQLSIANALWGQKDYKFLKNFLNLISSSYTGGFYEVDFANATEESRKAINQWVEKKTQDKIKELILPSDLDSSTRLVLTNAIYFKGSWMSRFKKEATQNSTFQLINGEKIDVPMMNQNAKFNYAEDETLQILEMPYIGNELSMVIFLPKQADGIKQIEESFSIENFKVWLSELHSQEVFVTVPKFKNTSRFYLEKTLSEMGMVDAFLLPPADFSGMTGVKDLFISHVIHKAFVDVNEEGTEAAAATAVVMTKGIFVSESFTANHPFIFVIRNIRSGSILFIGRVMDPR